MKKVIAIFLLISFTHISYATSDDILLDCKETYIDGEDYGKNTFIYGGSATYIGDAINYNDFLADEQRNIYQILGDSGKMHIKINDKTSPQYNYIYNEMSDIDIRNGKALFKVYDSDRKQFLIYFDGENFQKTEAFTNVYAFKLSKNGGNHAFLVIKGDNQRELYVNNKMIDSGMVTDEFAFSDDAKSFSYVKLSGEQKQSLTPGKYYFPDVELYKDGKILKTFKDSSYHSRSMRYFGSTNSVGLGIIPEEKESFDGSPGETFIFMRDGEPYDLPEEITYLGDALYSNDGSQFYTKIDTNRWTSYITDGKNKSREFDLVDDLKMNSDTGKIFFFATKSNEVNPFMYNRFLVYDWREVLDTSPLVQEYEKIALEKKDSWVADSYIEYKGSFFGKEDNFYTIDIARNKEFSGYYIRKNLGEHQKLDIGNPYQGKIGIFKKSFGYFIKNEETKGGIYNLCSVKQLQTEKTEDDNSEITKVEKKSDLNKDFRSIINKKLSIIDGKLSPKKKVELYTKLKTLLEKTPEKKRNDKFNILLDLAKIHYNKAIKMSILEGRIGK